MCTLWVSKIQFSCGIFDDSHKREMIKRISLNKENILNNLHLLLTQTGNRADIVFSSELPVLPKPGSLSRMQEGSRIRVDIHFFPQNLSKIKNSGPS